MSKPAANYRMATAAAKCRDCTMFRSPRSCTLVKGDISPEGVCKYFKEKPSNG